MAEAPLLSEEVLSIQVAMVTTLKSDAALQAAREVAAITGRSVLEELERMRRQGIRGGRG